LNLYFSKEYLKSILHLCWPCCNSITIYLLKT